MMGSPLPVTLKAGGRERGEMGKVVYEERRRREEGGGGGRREKEGEKEEGNRGGGRREEGGETGGIHSLSSQQSISMQRHPCSNARM